MYEMAQNYLSLLVFLSLPIPFCPTLYQDSSVTLVGLVSPSWFITVQVGGNKEAIMAQMVEKEPGRWAIDLPGDYF